MKHRHTIKAIERRAKEKGVAISALLQIADIHRSTWARWKSGDNGPTMAKWNRVEDAAAKLGIGADA